MHNCLPILYSDMIHDNRVGNLHLIPNTTMFAYDGLLHRDFLPNRCTFPDHGVLSDLYKYSKEEALHNLDSSIDATFKTFNFNIIKGILNGEIWSLFDSYVNAMGRWPYWPSRMEVSYCTFGFGAICAHYRYHVIHRGITYMRAWFKSTRERHLTLNKIVWRA